MSDSAKGPGSGYIFQFEVALLELSRLDKDQKISIEKVDDVAKEDKEGTYLCTIQLKHSIVLGETHFGNTSEDLWKTFGIWINKLKSGALNTDNEFIASTNNTIPNNSIIRLFNKIDFEDLVKKIEEILKHQLSKLTEQQAKGKSGASIKKIIPKIQFALDHKSELETIIKNFKFHEYKEVKEAVLNGLQLANVPSDVQDGYYHQLLGWIIDCSKENWLNGSEAVFSKSDFADRFNLIRDQHPIKQAIFRTKQILKLSHSTDTGHLDRSMLYIRQIEDIDRNNDHKTEIIEKAFMDFVFCEIEMAHLIKTRNVITQTDYEEFQERCIEKWKKVCREHLLHNASSYTEQELNDIAIRIYDQIMDSLNVEFTGAISFDYTNKYVQNGTFLNLSNIPSLGWHPNWKTKYRNS